MQLHLLVIQVTAQVTRRGRSTRIPEHFWSPGGRGCSRVPEAWAEEAGTDRNLCPSSALVLCTSPAPTPLRRETHSDSTVASFRTQPNKATLDLPLPFLMTIFTILMSPPLVRARKSLSSGVAGVTRYEAEKSKLRMRKWRRCQGCL